MSRDKRKKEIGDDGRTVADMSELGPAPVLFPHRRKTRDPDADEKKDPQFLTGKEKAAYIFGTLKAALLIGAVFAVAFALLIVLMLLIGAR